ncbi:hypothetical protein DBO95_18905 [Yersinia pestis]|nr:hypothetical protein DBO95_18905 [Yersinia pestis]
MWCFTSTRQSIYPKSLVEQQAGSKQTRPDELTSVSDSGKCAQLTPLLFQGRRELRLNKMLTIVSKLGD